MKNEITKVLPLQQFIFALTPPNTIIQTSGLLSILCYDLQDAMNRAATAVQNNKTPIMACYIGALVPPVIEEAPGERKREKKTDYTKESYTELVQLLKDKFATSDEEKAVLEGIIRRIGEGA